MKNLFTYPSDSGTYYIDATHIGDGTYGLSYRVDEMLQGNYLAHEGLDPVVDLGQTWQALTPELSKYINYFDDHKGLEFLSQYDFWDLPLVTATTALNEWTVDVVDLNPATFGYTPTNHFAEFYTTEDHALWGGIKVNVTGLTGSLAPINGELFTLWRHSANDNFVLAWPSGELVKFYDVGQDFGVSCDDGEPIVFTKVGHELFSGMEVTVTDFDGPFGLYENGKNFYVNVLTADTFNLAFDQGLTQLYDINDVSATNETVYYSYLTGDTPQILVGISDTLDARAMTPYAGTPLVDGVLQFNPADYEDYPHLFISQTNYVGARKYFKMYPTHSTVGTNNYKPFDRSNSIDDVSELANAIDLQHHNYPLEPTYVTANSDFVVSVPVANPLITTFDGVEYADIHTANDLVGNNRRFSQILGTNYWSNGFTATYLGTDTVRNYYKLADFDTSEYYGDIKMTYDTWDTTIDTRAYFVGTIEDDGGNMLLGYDYTYTVLDGNDANLFVDDGSKPVSIAYYDTVNFTENETNVYLEDTGYTRNGDPIVQITTGGGTPTPVEVPATSATPKTHPSLGFYIPNPNPGTFLWPGEDFITGEFDVVDFLLGTNGVYDPINGPTPNGSLYGNHLKMTTTGNLPVTGPWANDFSQMMFNVDTSSVDIINGGTAYNNLNRQTLFSFLVKCWLPDHNKHCAGWFNADFYDTVETDYTMDLFGQLFEYDPETGMVGELIDLSLYEDINGKLNVSTSFIPMPCSVDTSTNPTVTTSYLSPVRDNDGDPFHGLVTLDADVPSGTIVLETASYYLAVYPTPYTYNSKKVYWFPYTLNILDTYRDLLDTDNVLDDSFLGNYVVSDNTQYDHYNESVHSKTFNGFDTAPSTFSLTNETNYNDLVVQMDWMREFNEFDGTDYVLRTRIDEVTGQADVGVSGVSTTGTVTEVYDYGADGDTIAGYDIEAQWTGTATVSPDASEPYPNYLDSVDIRLGGSHEFMWKDSNCDLQPGMNWFNYYTPGDVDPVNNSASLGTLDLVPDASGHVVDAVLGPIWDRGAYPASDTEFALNINVLDDDPACVPATVVDDGTQWRDFGDNALKVWPEIAPQSATIEYSMPSSVTKSLTGTKYSLPTGRYKWQIEFVYPPLTEDQFQQINAVAHAVSGVANPFYLPLVYNGEKILWDHGNDVPSVVRFRKEAIDNNTNNIIEEGLKTFLVDGFDGSQVDAFKSGEIVGLEPNINGGLNTVVNTVNANVFGEAMISIASPLEFDHYNGELITKVPDSCVVTLADNEYTYVRRTDGLYEVTVKFNLDKFED